MSYSFPEDLGVLQTWLAGHGLKPSAIATERQAAFHAQKLAGTYHKFPPKGHSCRSVLLAIQSAVIKKSNDRRATSNSKPGAKHRKARTKPAAPPVDACYLIIFTHGYASPNPGRGGWGFVAYVEGAEVVAKFGGDTETISDTMELEAIASALNFVFYSRGTRPRGCSVRIRSDSKYAVGVATKALRPKENNAMIDCIHMFLVDMPTVTIEWCAGEPGNERAHELAEQGRMGEVASE